MGTLTSVAMFVSSSVQEEEEMIVIDGNISPQKKSLLKFTK